MTSLTPDILNVADRPEIFIGFVAPLGTPLPLVQRCVETDLQARGYEVHPIRLSELIEGVEAAHSQGSESEYHRIRTLMDRGNSLREKAGGGHALALLAAARVNEMRPDEEHPILDGHAFVFRQLKHPEEAEWFRLIYGPAFHMIGVYAPEEERRKNLRQNGLTDEEADELLRRDQTEGAGLGQRLRDTFHQADVFIRATGPTDATEAEIRRYLRLVFRDLTEGIDTPTRDEYGMFLAAGAALRSADLSRQVGAAVLAERGEVLGLGANEVPRTGGGQYRNDEESDHRDFAVGGDANAQEKQRIAEEVASQLSDEIPELDDEAKKEVIGRVLRNSPLMDLTEFGRAVHAEMEAILSAARTGVSTCGAQLFTTTFPCHNCAKHLLDAGVQRVVYVEPYPKSKALELHSDALRLAEARSSSGRVSATGPMVLEPFVGVAPRRYWPLFSIVDESGTRVRRKDRSGKPLEVVHGLRTERAALNYMEREAAVSAALNRFVSSKREGE